MQEKPHRYLLGQALWPCETKNEICRPTQLQATLDSTKRKMQEKPHRYHMGPSSVTLWDEKRKYVYATTGYTGLHEVKNAGETSQISYGAELCDPVRRKTKYVRNCRLHWTAWSEKCWRNLTDIVWGRALWPYETRKENRCTKILPCLKT
jgi:hypothetical protein